MLFSALEIVLLSVLSLCFILQLLYYWVMLAKPYYYMRAVSQSKINFQDAQPAVSIIVCVKNQYYDLHQFLPAILEQDYPEFEVIIVNDGTTDQNEDALTLLKAQYSNLHSTYIPDDTKNISRKKLGLTLGVKAAKYDTLLFTEADSRVRSKNWISMMCRHFHDKKTLVLGFSAKKDAGAFFSGFIAYDYFFTNLQMFSMALAKYPYAGYGRNLAYAKSHFKEQKGFVKYLGLLSGEDDLFVNDIATGENTTVELSPESVVFADLNIYEWKTRKLDRAVTKRYYKQGPVAFWNLEYASRIIFLICVATCLIMCCFHPFSHLILPAIALFLFLVRLFTQIFVINKTAEHLKLKKFYTAIPLFDLIQTFINAYFSLCGLFKKKENYTFRYEKR
jgi:glycosyltransferase involved in cell wall biosynthesis